MNYKKVINFSNIERILKKHKIKNQKIVHCHGVFDLLHIGHLKHFETAKKKGDILIVSITDDQYIDKGFNRPFFKNQQRLESLASIEDINYVVLNNTSTAVNIINKIKPDFYCKGPDYKNQKDDVTGQIKYEINAVKKSGGKIVITNDTTYSSSSILNNATSSFNSNQKTFLKKIKTEANLLKFSTQIKKLEKLKVLIIGETIIDKYIFCEALGNLVKNLI